MQSSKRFFGRVRVENGVPFWPDGSLLDGVDITHWACWRRRVERTVPRPGEPGFQRLLRFERA